MNTINLQNKIKEFLENNNKSCLCIIGPTASGKTKLSFELAKYFDIEIINADSRQIYKYLDIGTSKPTKSEQKKIPHHILDIKNPDEEFSLYEFQKLAYKKINEIHQKQKIPCIVGGTGLYIDSLRKGYNLSNIYDKKLRQKLENKYDKDKHKLYNQLIKLNSKYENLDINRKPIIIRTLEKELHKVKIKKNLPKYNFFTIFLNIERKILYEKINQRVEEMFELGFIKEVQTILKQYSKESFGLNTIGYTEIINFLDKKIDLNTCKEKIKQKTRNYAKRQLTWWRNNNNINCIYEI